MKKKIIIVGPERINTLAFALTGKCDCELHLVNEVSREDVVSEFQEIEMKLRNTYKQPDKLYPVIGSKFHK